MLSVSARPETAPAAEIHALILISGAFVVVVVVVLGGGGGFELSVQEAKSIEEGRGSRSFSAGLRSCCSERKGAEDRQECPRRRDQLSTDRSLIKPYGRYLRGTRTSLRSVRALMDLCGKY